MAIGRGEKSGFLSKNPTSDAFQLGDSSGFYDDSVVLWIFLEKTRLLVIVS
ncbi:MAG: hypothetical protein IGS23_14425 [Rivularia sp. T60_A2020_040]|nr:hypothetical protein [Rivularia sp. T60_A2020_040]